MIKLIFKAYKKTNKLFFIIFFSIYKNDNYYRKHRERIGKKVCKNIKIFLKKKKAKGEKKLK